MANEKQVQLIRSSLTAWNAWREQNLAVIVDLSGADLREANLRRADLRDSDLSGANLNGANLRNAGLSRSDLTRADLSRADLRGAYISDAHLNDTALESVNIGGAFLGDTIFADLDLRTVVGLDLCHHKGPSVVDHRTLMRSGPLPLPFLRGCGLPDNLIDYLPSIMGTSIQFYSCFISYSTSDQEFVERLHADLQNKGVRCWFAPHNIQAGKKIHEQIDEAIRVYDRLLLIISQHSMNSEWVKTEIAHARQKESNEKCRVLFPLSIVPFETIKTWKNFDADTGKDSGREIREYFIPDFSNWKDHDSYSTAFERLLRDLKSEEPARQQKAVTTLRVYKFLSALKVLQERRLKIAEINDLNDPSELIPFNLSDPKLRRAFLMTRDGMHEKHGFASPNNGQTRQSWSQQRKMGPRTCSSADTMDDIPDDLNPINSMRLSF
jgi:hypothetical protein